MGAGFVRQGSTRLGSHLALPYDGAVLKTPVLPEKQGPNEDQRAAAKLLRSDPPMFMCIMWQGLTKHQGMPPASPLGLASNPFEGLLFPLIS